MSHLCHAYLVVSVMRGWEPRTVRENRALTHRSLYLVWAFWVSVSMLGGCADRPASLSIPTLAPDGTAEPIPATLRQPDGPGPFQPSCSCMTAAASVAAPVVRPS